MRTIILALVLAATTPASADGQWLNPYTGTVWNNPMSSLADTMIRNKMMETAMVNAVKNRQANPAAPSTPSAPVAHQPYTKSDFKPGKQRLVVDAIISGLAQNAEQKQGLMQGMEMVFQQYEKTIRKNNVAYALAIGASLQVQTGQTIDDAQGEQLAQALNDARCEPGVRAGERRGSPEALRGVRHDGRPRGAVQRGRQEGPGVGERGEAPREAVARDARRPLGCDVSMSQHPRL
jgi:hypothetical protein